MQSCFLCGSDLAPILAESEHWRLVLNINQNFLGKCMWVLRRHVEAVPELSPPEWAELHVMLIRTRETLHRAFQPVHYNYAFMQNQDRHVHMHVIPRYAASRIYEGVTFSDPDWPGHYTALNPSCRLAPETMKRLAEHLQQIWSQIGV